MELRRRVILLVCLWSACWLSYYAPLGPLVTVEPVEPEKYEEAHKQALRRAEAASVPDEGGLTGKDEGGLTDNGKGDAAGKPDGDALEKSLSKPLLDKPRDFSFDAITRGKLIRLTGPRWEDFYLYTAREGRGVHRPADWDGRVSSSGYYNSSHLFFYPREAPVNSLMEHFKKDLDELYAAVEVEGKTRYLHFSYRVYTEDVFHWGSGFSAYPNPPSYMLYPARRFALWMGGAALVIHFLPAGRKKNKGAVSYARWRVALGDVFALILAVPFFLLPMMVIGGSVQAVTLAWPLSAVMWPMAFAGGAVLLTYSTWYASYEVSLLKDGIGISSYKGAKEYKFSDITYHQRAQIRAPGWFVRFMRIAAFFNPRLAANAALVSSSAYRGIALGLRDKGIVYIWVADQMGSAAMKGYGAILHALKEGGIPEVGDERVVESMGLVTEEPPEGQKRMDRAAAVIYSLLLAPVVVAVIGFIYVMFFYRY